MGWCVHRSVGNFCLAGELVSGLTVSPESWTRAGHLAAKILRKHARTEMFDSLA